MKKNTVGATKRQFNAANSWRMVFALLG